MKRTKEMMRYSLAARKSNDKMEYVCLSLSYRGAVKSVMFELEDKRKEDRSGNRKQQWSKKHKDSQNMNPSPFSCIASDTWFLRKSGPLGTYFTVLSSGLWRDEILVAELLGPDLYSQQKC